jgi:hypothetical protein
LVLDRYDIILTASSWDERCRSLLSIEVTADLTLCIVPVQKDNSGLTEANTALIQEFWSKRSTKLTIIDADPLEPKPTWDSIRKIVETHIKNLTQPLRVLIDLSACCRYWTLGLVAMFIKYGSFSSIDVAYTEANYNIVHQDLSVEFRMGKWTTVPIPFLDGTYDPIRQKAYIVSTGFEGERTYRLISRGEPDSLFLLVPDPPVKADYLQLSLDANKSIVDDYCLTSQQSIKGSAADAVQCWEKLTQANVEDPLSNNIFYLCCGTKPHSLAMAVRAAILGYPTVLYVIPDRHSPSTVKSAGNFWLYRFVDLSSFAVKT